MSKHDEKKAEHTHGSRADKSRSSGTKPDTNQARTAGHRDDKENACKGHGAKGPALNKSGAYRVVSVRQAAPELTFTGSMPESTANTRRDEVPAKTASSKRKKAREVSSPLTSF